MKLYDYSKSSASYRVRIALNLKGLAYQSHTVSLLDGDQRGDNYLALNPSGLVPALIDNGKVLTQSLASLSTWKRLTLLRRYCRRIPLPAPVAGQSPSTLPAISIP